MLPDCRIAALACLLVGCGAPPMHVAETCTSGQGWTLELEEGVLGPCDTVREPLESIVDVYAGRWGAPGIGGWTVRVRVQTEPTTWHGQSTVDLQDGMARLFVHELHHVQLGPSSSDHHGWCGAFTEWEKAYAEVDDDVYLGCR